MAPGHGRVEPVLHPVEDVLILPALDTPQLGRVHWDLSGHVKQALRVAVEVEVFGVIRPAIGSLRSFALAGQV